MVSSSNKKNKYISENIIALDRLKKASINLIVFEIGRLDWFT